jgi:hypothetical protein
LIFLREVKRNKWRVIMVCQTSSNNYVFKLSDDMLSFMAKLLTQLLIFFLLKKNHKIM